MPRGEEYKVTYDVQLDYSSLEELKEETKFIHTKGEYSFMIEVVAGEDIIGNAFYNGDEKNIEIEDEIIIEKAE